jgi:hypothetical protein
VFGIIHVPILSWGFLKVNRASAAGVHFCSMSSHPPACCQGLLHIVEKIPAGRINVEETRKDGGRQGVHKETQFTEGLLM